VFLFLVAEAALWFFADPLLRTVIQTFVEKESKGVYSIDFSALQIELTTRTLKLNDFKLKADTARYRELKKQGLANKALYQIEFDRLKFSKLKLYKLFKESELIFDEISISTPVINLIGLPKKEKQEEKYDAVHNDLYAAINPYLNALACNKISLSDGYFDMYLADTDIEQKTSADRISVELYQFRVDSLIHEKKDQLFFSKDFFLKTENYRLLLNDKIHSVLVGEISVSTIEKEISIKDAIIRPGFVSEKSSEAAIYKARIPQMKFYGTDIYNAWFNHEISIDSIFIDSANVKIISPVEKKESENVKLKKKKTNIKNFYDLVKGKVNIAEVKKFTFSNAQFDFEKGIYNKKQKIKVRNCSLSLQNFLLDSLSEQRENKIMFADNFTLSVDDYSMQFAKQTHTLEAKKFLISTSQKLIAAEGVKIKPEGSSDSPKLQIMDIYIPSLQLTSVDFFTAYNSGVLNTGGLFISHPSFNITKLGEPHSTKKAKNPGMIYNVVSEYLNTLNINTFKINKGKFNYHNKTKANKNAFSKGTISLKMDRIRLDEQTALYSDKLIHARTFDIRLSDFSMKNNTDFHVVEAELLRISSFDSLVYAQNLQIFPKYKDSALKTLKLYEKNSFSKILLPEFHIKGLDVQQVIFGKELSVESVYLSKPSFQIREYTDLKYLQLDSLNLDSLQVAENEIDSVLVERNNAISTDSIISTSDTTEIRLNNAYKNSIISLLKDKMNLVDIAEINIDSAFIKIEKYDTLEHKLSGFENRVSAKMHNFYLNQDSLSASYNKFLFADSLKVKVYSFETVLPDKLHKVKAANLVFSSSDSSIRANHVRVFPLEEKNKEIQKPSTFILFFPEIGITGLNPEKLLTEKYLDINEIEANEPAIIVTRHLDIPIAEEQKDTVEKKINVAVPKGLAGIAIKNIKVSNGKIELANESNKNITRYATTDLNLLLENIKLDSTNLDSGKSLLSADNAGITLTNAKLTLPDSIYKFSADTLNLSILKSSFTGVNVKFSYDSLLNTSLLPENMKQNSLMAFDIPRIEVNGINYFDIILKKEIYVKSVAVQQPQIKIHQFKKPKVKKTLGETEAEIIAKLSKRFKKFNIEELKLIDADFFLKNTVKKKKSSVFMEDITGKIVDFDIDTLKNNNPKRLLLSKDISLHFHKYAFVMKDSMYNVNLNEIGVSSLKSKIYVNDFSMMPRYGQYEFARKYGLQKGVMYIEGKKLQAQGIDFRELIENKTFDIKMVEADAFKMHIFKDKQLSEDTLIRPVMPLNLIRRSKNRINIDSVLLKNSYIAYEQNSKKKSSTGVFTLEELNGTITNLTNDTSTFRKKKNTQMKITALLMGKGRMNASFRFPLSTQKSEYLLAGSVDTFDLAEMNPMIENTVFVSVTEGKSDKLQFHIKANEEFAEGKMRLYYSNLKIKIKDTANSKRNGASMLANSILRSNNPKREGRKLIEGKIYSEQVVHKNVFHLWTQAIISGAVSSLGYRTKQMKRKDKLKKLLARKIKKQEKIDRKTEKKLKKDMEQELRRMAREQRKKARKGEKNN